MHAIGCDLLLFVATSTELDELKRTAIQLGLEWRKLGSELGDCWSVGTIGAYRVAAVRTEMGSVGPMGSTRNAHFYLTTTGAQGLICLGMAFGISRELQPVGTVLVSESLFPYDVRDVVIDPDQRAGTPVRGCGTQHCRWRDGRARALVSRRARKSALDRGQRYL